MITARNERGEKFTEAELMGNALTILLAGEDTTANTLAWAVHYLADRPDLQELMHNEIQAQLSGQAQLSYDQLDEFPITFAAVQEAMRMMPVAPMLYLENNFDEVVNGYAIPAGTMQITVPSHGGKLEDNFENPDEFDPNRWLNMTEQTRKHNAKVLMSFGAGPRICPGRLLSFIEMKTAMVSILGSFKISRHPDYKNVVDSFEFTLVPRGLNVIFEKRR